VPRIVGAFAAGRLMNTRTVHSQYMGGMIWGISSALHEATEIDPRYARYVNDNLADYMVPVNADVNEVTVILVPEVDHDVNPVGVKGLGELANVGTAAAVANAVYHATGNASGNCRFDLRTCYRDDSNERLVRDSNERLVLRLAWN
jgi:xanthine dehydrogenase YagR molybdenum-binding subunit